ncbi:MAG TPA: GPP34 family phosphoprotein [Amycolatopsis sp.]|nr:GPP34 family phosphoprotein [Amycolatopsis sp.]
MIHSLSARAYLLACDADKGRVHDRRRVALLVRAAAFADLLLRGRVVDHSGRVTATGLGPTGDRLLDDLLTQVVGYGPVAWRPLLRRDSGDTLRALEHHLAGAGVLEARTTRLLHRTVLRLTDPAAARQARASADHALRAPLSEVDPEDGVLTALAAAAGTGVGRAEAHRHATRLAQLAAAGGAAVPELRRAVRRLRARRVAVASGGGG